MAQSSSSSLLLLVAIVAMATTLTVSVVEAFASSSSSSAFVGSNRHMIVSSAATSSSSSSCLLRMDMERDDTLFDKKARYKLEQTLLQHAHHSQHAHPSIEQAQAVHGMPWKTSIDPKSSFSQNLKEELLYMPFWEWQLQFMQDHLTNLQVVPTTCQQYDFSYQENTHKKARIINMCFRSQEYRKIRMTYYDAGDNTQVFNAVWYPDPAYGDLLPILGIDLLAFNRKKYLAIVDFQPLHDHNTEDDQQQQQGASSSSFEHLLKPIKEQYPTLKGRMSNKFYDETQFFSQQMLFARFEDESVITKELFPAFQSYVQTHVDLVQRSTRTPTTKTTTPNPAQNVDWVLQRQQAYDTYSAERDPATGLFTAMFGEEWAQAFVHDFLFSLSERRPQTAGGSTPPVVMPSFMGGGLPPSPPQQPQTTQQSSSSSPSSSSSHAHQPPQATAAAVAR